MQRRALCNQPLDLAPYERLDSAQGHFDSRGDGQHYQQAQLARTHFDRNIARELLGLY